MPKYRIAVNVTVDAEDLTQAENYSKMIKNTLSGWTISTIAVSNLDKITVDQKENGYYIGLAVEDN